MKSQKKISLLLLFIALSSITIAQLRVGIHAGLNISKMLPWDEKMIEYVSSDLSPRLGANFGFTFDGKFSQHWGYMTSLNFSQLGYIETNNNPYPYEYDPSVYYVESTYKNSVILVPLDISYNFKFNNFKLIVFGGPGVGCSILRKIESELFVGPYGYSPYSSSYNIPTNNQSESSYYSATVENTSNEPTFELFANVGIGIEYKNFMFKTSCEAFSYNKNYDPRILNYNITLCYYIGKF